MSDTIESKVNEILSQYVDVEVLAGKSGGTIQLLDLGINSAEMINIIIAIEDTFDMDVSDEYVHTLRTIADIVDAVRREQASA